MKVSCEKKYLERALATAERFAGKNLTLPVLANVLVEADEKSARISATNLEHAVEISVPGSVRRHGRVSVPARVVSSLIQSVQDGPVELEEKQGNLFISAGLRHSRVNGIPAEEFPLIPKIKKTSGFSPDAEDLSRALGHILPAVSSSDFKPELGGVFLKAQQKELILAGTDTFRLAEESVPLREPPTAPVSCIVPQRAAQELARIFSEYKDERPEVALGESQMVVRIGPVQITSRLIEGAFPEYRAIIPSQFETSAFIGREELVSAVKSSGIFVSKLQEVSLGFSDGFVEVVSANQEVGEYRTKIKINSTGKGAVMSFNYRYLSDGLQALDEDEIFFGCRDATSPALIRNKSSRAFTYVVMPIRIT